ncbi:hypothetical protein VF13_35675, partial [Nostoc linckia z16]
MSLLMASVLVTAPLSALNLPEQPVIEPDNQVQESTQKNLSEVVPPVEITPPEFVQPDISTSIVAKAKYENILKKSREKIQFISSSNSPESKNTQPLPDEADKNYSH